MTPITEFAGREFAAGVVTGVRSFAVDRLARLTGIHHRQVWRPGENTSECRASNRAPSTPLEYQVALKEWERAMLDWQRDAHEIQRSDLFFAADRGGRRGGVIDRSFGFRPSPPEKPKPPALHSLATCTCGFYGYYDGSDDYRSSSSVSAVVEGYGEVLIGTRGFRATKARIVALCSLRTQRAGLSDIEVQIFERIARLYPDAATFDDFEDMVAAHPADTALEHTPENDPDFWTRTA